MFRTILVPLDGTRFAESALPIATRLARGGSSSLHLVLAHQLVPALVGMGEFALPLTNIDEEQRTEEASYLTRTAEELAMAGAGPVEYREADGPAGPAICEEAIRLDADLVVMTTHGRGGARRLWHGSVADYVVRHLTVPVLLTHPDHPKTRSADSALRGILVALDLSQDSEAILEPVEKLARITHAPVTLMHVAKEPVLGVWQDFEAPRRLDRIADRLRERGVVVSIRVTTGISAASSLRDALRESRFDMMAMTTHGAGGLRRMWMGSVADSVVRSASKPVLILRPRTPIKEAL
jgi:nucleotide-binding universal stress UspA family protein